MVHIFSNDSTHVLGLVVLVDDLRGLAAAARNLNRNNLLLEPAGLRRGNGLLVGADAVVVLLLTVEAVVVGALLGRQTHVLVRVRVGQTILEDTIDEGLVAELGTRAQVGQIVGSVGHALGTSSDDDVGIAGDDGLSTDDEGLDRRGAHLVDGGADDGLGEACSDGTLAGGILAKAGVLLER